MAALAAERAAFGAVGLPPAAAHAGHMQDHEMQVDWQPPKRRRADTGGLWHQGSGSDSSVLWGLCDALSLYASGSSCGSTAPATRRRCAPASPVPGCVFGPPSPSSCSDVEQPKGASLPRSAAPRAGAGEPAAQLLVAPLRGGGPTKLAAAAEPLLRALTQLANTAAAGSLARRQLVAECQVQVPLLRLMQGPWGRQPLVAERCCRLLHWLCHRAPENREALAACCGPSPCGRARPASVVDAVLSMAEAHASCREVLAHAMRALVTLLPCPRVREELLRTQPQLLKCLALAGEALDVSAVRSVCRWLPGIPCRVWQARGRAEVPRAAEGAWPPLSQDSDDDVHMADV